MSNIFSLQEAQNRRQLIQDYLRDSKERMAGAHALTILMHENILEHSKDTHTAPLFRRQVEVAVAIWKDEKFKNLAGDIAWLLINKAHSLSDIFNAEPQDDLSHITLVNAFQVGDDPFDQRVVWGLYSEAAFQREFNLRAKDLFANDNELISDAKEARRIVYDYVYTHQDVDTERDNSLSTYAYAAAGILLEQFNYSVTGYHYATSLSYPNGKKDLSKLVMRFDRIVDGVIALSDRVYMVLDVENSFWARDQFLLTQQ